MPVSTTDRSNHLDVASATRHVVEDGLALEVYPSRGQLLFFFFLGLAIIGLGLLLFRWAADAAPGFERVFLHYGMGGFIMLFGLWVTVEYARRLLRRGPALVLDRQGIHDYTNSRKAIFVPWSEMSRVFVGKHVRKGHVAHRFVSIEVADPEALRGRVGGRRYALLSLARGQTGALVNISENLLPEPAEHWVPILRALARQLGTTPPIQPEAPRLNLTRFHSAGESDRTSCAERKQ